MGWGSAPFSRPALLGSEIAWYVSKSNFRTLRRDDLRQRLPLGGRSGIIAVGFSDGASGRFLV